jgi:hypothetical protein
MKRLVIFCTSLRPDPYFNVIAHAVVSLEIRDFVLVVVEDGLSPKGATAAKLADDLGMFVQNLRVAGDGTEGTTSAEDAVKFSRYTDLIGWESLKIARMGISEDGLSDFLAAEAALGSSFDVTSCKNSVVAGVTAALVSRGGSPIYSFEFRRKPTFSQTDLLPLLDTSDYAYRNLADSALLSAALRKVNSFRFDRNVFLVVSVALAFVFGLSSLFLSQTIVFSLLTGFASFASIVSAFGFFLRD